MSIRIFWQRVGLLSNLLGFWHHPDAEPLTVRTARQDEVEAALRIILAPPGVAADPRAIDDFVSFARDRGIDTSSLHVAERGGKIYSALLPVVSPGRTTLLLSPHGGLGKQADAALAQLIDPVCRHIAAQGVHLAQTLVDPADQALERIFTDAGFDKMAELHYLQVQPAPDTAYPNPPPGVTWSSYSADDHDLFGRAILDSYQQSLDCPALNGRRDIEDIIAGHQASGNFDPTLWFLLREGATSLGVLLLSQSLRSDAIELVYLGLAPAARGRKLGELMMRQALAATAERKQAKLCLAVDAQNAPALKLYYRHGMQRIGSKLALLRDLRNPGRNE
jgi:GNAT superfamily N-acetyltransferase